MNQTKFDDEGEYRYVKVDESGKEIVEKDDYRIVRADEEENPEKKDEDPEKTKDHKPE